MVKLQSVKYACQRLMLALEQTKVVSKENKTILRGKIFGIFKEICEANPAQLASLAEKYAIANASNLTKVDIQDALVRKILGIATDQWSEGSRIAEDLLALCVS